MFISKGYKGNFYLYYKQSNGKLTKVSCKTKLKKEANEFLRNFNNQSINKPVKISVLYLDKFIEDVMKYVTENFRASTQNIYKNALNKFVSIVGNKPILSITSKEIEKYKSERIKQVNKTTANIDIRTIKAVFNLALKWKLINENPCTDIKQYKIEEKEILAFSDNEIELLLNSITNQKLKLIVEFALNSGLRISELVNLTIEDINYNEHSIIIRNKNGFSTKSGKNRKIPLTNKLFTILTELRNMKSNNISRINNNYLFVNEIGNQYSRTRLTMLFKACLRKAGLPEKYHFHCLRHKFLSNCIRAGININYVKELAGHSNIQTSMNYITVFSEDLRKAVNSI